jgi:hypothetical protein
VREVALTEGSVLVTRPSPGREPFCCFVLSIEMRSFPVVGRGENVRGLRLAEICQLGVTELQRYIPGMS